jgi:nucleoside-diphosphate-sugar epimerase
MSAGVISRKTTSAERILAGQNTIGPSVSEVLSRPETVEQLDELLSAPTPEVVETLARLAGDILVLGVAGKMGPTLARMARRASQARVIGVSRFSSPGQQESLEAHGVETIRCDLLDEGALARLPDAPNVVFMAGMKFGSTGQEARTWVMNCYLPALVCRRYAQSRIVAFSTGNVYGLTPAGAGGSVESDALKPVGDYAMSCLGRERIFEHFSRSQGTRVALIRLNYANELRYGVLVDLARSVHAGETVDLTMGFLNAIWQADANAMALRAFDHVAAPAFVVNVAGPEQLRVRDVCESLGRLMGRTPRFTGRESEDALLSNSGLARRLFGAPRIDARTMTEWSAGWVMAGGESLDKPTHFAVRDGRF